MKTINTITDVINELKEVRMADKSIGFIPTMGYLHDGHISLINQAKKENDFVVISIFVNPTQFGEGEDFERYPKDLKRDSILAKDAGVDIIFAPSAKEMYPLGYSSYVEVEGEISQRLCGTSRPSHFKGVTTVVSKLFNIIMPERAYFGQKDAQQLAVIKQMTKDLNFNIQIVGCPIIREEDGLALSSRNVYLTKKERQDALVLSQSLFKSDEMITNGERDVVRIKQFIKDNIEKKYNTIIDYIEIVDADTLRNLEKIQGNVLIALAVKIGQTRLIDNILLEVN
jgi:pantoate--beta-alanine ligase